MKKDLDGSAGDGLTGASTRLNARARALTYLAAGQALSGLENCHVPGMYSVVLEERESDAKGMLRIFYAGRDCRIANLFHAGEFSLLPHNHRQAITLWGLFGNAFNATADFGGGFPVQEYRFGSALLNGEFSLEPTRKRLATFSLEAIDTDPIRLAASDVHTVLADPESAWVVEEGAISTLPALCYSYRENPSLDRAGLYKPMTRDHLSRICNRILTSASESVSGLPANRPQSQIPPSNGGKT